MYVDSKERNEAYKLQVHYLRRVPNGQMMAVVTVHDEGPVFLEFDNESCYFLREVEDIVNTAKTLTSGKKHD